MVFKDHVAKYIGEKGAGVLANSKDAIHWTVAPSPKAFSRTLHYNDATTETKGQLERFFIFFENEKPAYLFFATMDGPGGFEHGTHSWNVVVPFKK